MKFLRSLIGEELKKQLQKGYNIERISNWAINLADFTPGEMDKEVSDVLNSLSVMEAGPEFEYTEEELKKLAELLLNGEKDPIKIVDAMRFNETNENDPKKSM